MSYEPCGRPDSLYSPVELVAIWRLMPRSGLATTTLAPAMAAPEGSLTVPVIEPVVWAHPATQNVNTTSSTREDFIVMAPMGADIAARVSAASRAIFEP